MQNIIASIDKENDSYQNYYIYSLQLECQLLEYALKGNETQFYHWRHIYLKNILEKRILWLVQILASKPHNQRSNLIKAFDESSNNAFQSKIENEYKLKFPLIWQILSALTLDLIDFDLLSLSDYFYKVNHNSIILD